MEGVIVLYSIYISQLYLQSEKSEYNYITDFKKTCYSNVYPQKSGKNQGTVQNQGTVL